MERVIDCIAVFINPFFYLLFIFLIVAFVLRPLFRCLAVNKILREQQALHKEYLKHKEKIKKARLAARLRQQDQLLGRVNDGADESA